MMRRKNRKLASKNGLGTIGTLFTRIVSIIIILVTQGCSQPYFDEVAWRQSVERTSPTKLYEKNIQEDRYFNPWHDSVEKLEDLLNWLFADSEEYTEQEKAFLPEVRKNTLLEIKANHDRDYIVWIGHNSFLIKTGGEVWLTDPIFSERVMIKRRKTPPALTAEDINSMFPKVNVVISHNHYDHLDEKSIKRLSDDYHFFVPKGLKRQIKEWRPGVTVTEMDWWDITLVSAGNELHCLPAQHSSRRLFEDENASLWASYMIVTPKSNVFLGGDSGYFIGYQEIGKKYPDIDFALLPATANHPRWFMHADHMNVEEAILAFEQLGAKYFIPTQWGAFHLGDEPPGYPILELRRQIKRQSLQPESFIILDIGETRTF